MVGTIDASAAAQATFAKKVQLDGQTNATGAQSGQATKKIAGHETGRVETTRKTAGQESDGLTRQKAGSQDSLTREERQKQQKLEREDRQTRQHERAHKTVAGQYAGPIGYDYEKGPEGDRYAVGGSVHIDTSPIPGDPDATVEKMRQVIRAALAPADPSSQDLRAAANARAKLMEAQREAGPDESGPQNDTGSPQSKLPSSDAENGSGNTVTASNVRHGGNSSESEAAPRIGSPDAITEGSSAYREQASLSPDPPASGNGYVELA